MLTKFTLVKGVDSKKTNFLKAVLRQLADTDPEVLQLGERLKGVAWLAEKFQVSIKHGMACQAEPSA